jgi:N-acetylmuramoyl-L-alanine amidase
MMTKGSGLHLTGEKFMNTRREMAMALLALPLTVRDAHAQTNASAQQQAMPEPVAKPVRKTMPPPYSVDAASIISYTLYAEARGEPFEGLMAVASVIKTRSRRLNIPPAEVCLQNQQFSCWNSLDAVPAFFTAGEGIQPADLAARNQCFALAWVLLQGIADWDHFTHFYNPDKATPDWACELKGTRIIGRHVFGYIE